MPTKKAKGTATAEPAKKKEPMFEKDSIEALLKETTSINAHVLALEHSHFLMKMEGDELCFNIDHDMMVELYNDDIIEDYETESIKYIDIVLSPYKNTAFDWTRMTANRLNYDEYDKDDTDCQLYLMCLIAYSYFISKYDKIVSLTDITRPVPLQLFLNVLKKNNNLEVAYKDDEDNEYAGRLVQVAIQRSFFSSYIDIRISVVSRGKDGYSEGIVRFTRPIVDKIMKLDEIGLKLLTVEDKVRFTRRGQKYIECTCKPAYSFYKGFAYRYGGWWGDVRTNINGRIMIDINAMRALNPDLDDSWYKGSPFENNTSPIVSDTALWMCSPVVYGFSFMTKEWVRMGLDNVSPITFSETAFDELIVTKTYKDIFISCLTNDMPSLDSIEGKGTGKIFLLYGPPGCGKTMTAESVAEFLRIPLYYVSVGELGVAPETMEQALSRIMDVAISWNAIVLLDEVDVFAVKREGSDIQRNAMTAILLRLLERFNGIMFMTTNLINNLDPAFISRATACIPYEPLGTENKKLIWKSILTKASKLGISVEDKVYSSLEQLAHHELNGREIKNSIRLAYSVAMSSKDKVMTYDILTSVLNLRAI